MVSNVSDSTLSLNLHFICWNDYSFGLYVCLFFPDIQFLIYLNNTQQILAYRQDNEVLACNSDNEALSTVELLSFVLQT